MEPVLKEPEPSPLPEEDSTFDNGYMFEPREAAERTEADMPEEDPEFIPDMVTNEFDESIILDPGLKSTKEKYEQKRRERLANLGNTDHEYLQPNDIKDRLDKPAYTRKNVRLEDVPHSSERNISRLSLNDDSQILGNNKFLHDNVD